jgi:hypothetical protein
MSDSISRESYRECECECIKYTQHCPNPERRVVGSISNLNDLCYLSIYFFSLKSIGANAILVPRLFLVCIGSSSIYPQKNE